MCKWYWNGGKSGTGWGNGKHYLITSNLKSNCVVLLSILLLASAFGWILFIRFTLSHTHLHLHAHRISLAHTHQHMRACFFFIISIFLLEPASRFFLLLCCGSALFFMCYSILLSFAFDFLYVALTVLTQHWEIPIGFFAPLFSHFCA